MKRRDFLKGILAGVAATVVPVIGKFLPKATASTLTDGGWHKVVHTFDSGVVRCYIDDIQMIPEEGLIERFVNFDDEGGLINLSRMPMRGEGSKRTLSFRTKGTRLPKKNITSDLDYSGEFGDVKMWDNVLSEKELGVMS